MYCTIFVLLNSIKSIHQLIKPKKRKKKLFPFPLFWVYDTTYGRHFEWVLRMDFWFTLLPQCHKSSLDSRILPPIKNEGVHDSKLAKREKFLHYKLCHSASSAIMNSVFETQSFPKIISLHCFGIDNNPGNDPELILFELRSYFSACAKAFSVMQYPIPSI